MRGALFRASALHTEASECILSLEFHLECSASSPLVQDVPPAKPVLDTTQSFNVVFSSDWSSDRFTGKPYSAATGLYYYGARWYDPTIGRFISQDPYPGRLSNPQTLNPYTYVLNSPTNGVDPSGEISEACAFTNCCEFDNFGGCLSAAAASGAQWYTSLPPQQRQIVNLTFGVAIIAATGGEAAPYLLLAGGIGFGAGASAYTGYTYATGGTPTLTGALDWGSVGFTLAVAAYGGYQLAEKFLSEESEAEFLSVKTIGNQELPLQEEPNSLIRSFNNEGLHRVGIYDEQGFLSERIDVTGPAHNAVATPHAVEYYNWRPNINAPGGWAYSKRFLGSTNDFENEIIALLAVSED